MRFSTGILDALFGEKVELQVPRGDGTTMARKVSKRWIEAMERQGHVRQLSDDEVEARGLNSKEPKSHEGGCTARARELVGTAKMMAIGSNTTYCKKFPILGPVPTDKWDFFATVAAVWSASTMIEYHVPKSERTEVERAIEDGLREWHPSGLAAMEDLSKFVARSCEGKSGGDLIPASVGMWMLWNLLGHAPTDVEYPIAGVLGRMFCEEFAVYWGVA